MIPKIKERGYDTHILNLIDPMYSMGYNPLSLIIQEYKLGSEDTAQQLCASLGYNIFSKNEGEKDPYFTDQARNVFIAAVMADIKDNIELDREQNKRWKYEHEKREDERERAYFKKLYQDDYETYVIKTAVDDILSEAGDIENAGILVELKLRAAAASNSLSEDLMQLLDDLTEEMIEKARTFELKKSSFLRKRFYPSDENEKKINIYSIIKMCNFLASQKRGQNRTALDEYFEKRPEDDFSRIMYGSVITASENTKGTVMSVFRGGISIFGFESIAKMTAESTVDFMDIGFGEKPVAIFITLPDYDSSNWFIATVFINQLYFILAKCATAMPGGKLVRRVMFILDEFGNLPPIDNCENILTVCLGRNITFTLAIQDMAQLEQKYQNAAKIIKGNCGNWIYIMAGHEDTANEFSGKLGPETITTLNRTGKKLALTKELTEMSEDKPLLTGAELMRLKMGETVVVRILYRESKGTEPEIRIRANPIANMGKYSMKYAYEFLGDIFPQDQMLYISDRLLSMRENIPYLREMKINVANVGIDRTDHIDLNERSRSGGQYIEFQTYLTSPFVPFEEDVRSENNFVKLNTVLQLLNISEVELPMYLQAGLLTEDDEGQFQITLPEYVITNESLIEYAHQLWKCRSAEIQAKGYAIMDLVVPLKEKPLTAEEIMLMAEYEHEILSAVRMQI